MLNVKGTIFSIKTGNLDPMVAFYRSLFGKPSQHSPGQWAEFHLGGSRIVLWASGDKVTHQHAAVQLCIEVGDVVAVHSWIKAYVMPSQIQTASHGMEFTMSDPDENVVIFYQAKN